MSNKPKIEFLSLAFALILPFNDLLSLTYSVRKLRDQNVAKQVTVIKEVNSFPIQAEEESNDISWQERENKYFESNLTVSQSAPSASSSSQGQGDISGYTVSSTDGMVNKFTGDFNYAIPLMDVEGYPISINYNSNVSMNSEASWVGLGWDLSVGAVNREMRGIPDEFNGDQTIDRAYTQKADITSEGEKYGPRFKMSSSLLPDAHIPKSIGGISGTLLVGKYKNTYTGLSNTLDFGVQSELSIGDKLALGAKFGIGYSLDTKGGIGRNNTVGLSLSHKATELEGNLDFTKSFHSRKGQYEKGISPSIEKNGILNFINAGVSTATYVSYGTQTSIPRVQFNETGYSNSTSLSGNFGYVAGPAQKYYVGFVTTNYNHSRVLTKKIIKTPGLGYLHYGKADNIKSENILFDYNRGSNNPYSEKMHNLSFSFLTFDFFHASAYGLSGVFRPNRTDVGSVKNEYHILDSDGTSKAKDVSFIQNGSQNTILASVQKGKMKGDTYSGDWQTTSFIKYVTQPTGPKFDNSCYFKEVGENTPNNRDVWNAFGGEQVNTLNIVEDEDMLQIDITNDLINKNGILTPIDLNSINNFQTKPIVATSFKALTALELVDETTFESYEANIFWTLDIYKTTINRINQIRKENHISKIEITDLGGTKYEYGIPVYTKLQSEVSFSTEKDFQDLNTMGTITYNGVNGSYDGDNSLDNNKGLFNFYDKTTIPSYATSYLITKILSSDYKDISNNGLSPDDVGNYHKFNYTQFFGDESTRTDFYNWRYPMDKNANDALLNRGLLSLQNDNIASYSYGEKEVWYLHSVVSKNLIAEFKISSREDGHGVNNENGQQNNLKTLQKLESITLYNINERNQIDPKEGLKAIPLKTIYFYYNYELCKGDPSNRNPNSYSADTTGYYKSGKLTLKEIVIISGGSAELGSREQSKQSIKFEYSNINYDFSYKNVDTWGNFKLENQNKPNDINPYASQNISELNNSCKSWKLVKIKNMQGGEIEVEYEPDSYATVQNKRAMRHIDIHRMTNVVYLQYLKSRPTWNGQLYSSLNFTTDFSNNNLTNFLSSNTSMSNQNINEFKRKITGINSRKRGTNYSRQFGQFVPEFTPNNVIIFKLDEPINSTMVVSNVTIPVGIDEAGQIVKDKYFSRIVGDAIKTLYFRTHVKVKSDANYKELIPMVANISSDMNDMFDGLTSFSDDLNSIGVLPPVTSGGNYEYGYVVIDPVIVGTNENSEDEEYGEGEALTMQPLQKNALDFARKNLPSIVYGSCDGCDPDLSVDIVSLFNKNISRFMISKGYIPSLFSDFSTLRLYDFNNTKYASSARVKSIKFKDNWQSISDEEGDQILTGEDNSEYIWNYDYNLPNKLTATTSGVAAFEPRTILDENPFYEWRTYVDINKKFPDETNYNVSPIAEPLFPDATIGYGIVNVTFQSNLMNLQDYGKSVTKYYTAASYPTITDETSLGNPKKVIDNELITGNTVELFGFSQGYLIKTNDFHGKIKENSVLDKNDITISRTIYNYHDQEEDITFVDRNGSISDSKSSSEYDIHFDTKFIEDESTITSLGISGGLTFSGGSISPIIFANGFMAHRKRGFYSTSLVKHINYSAKIKSITTENFTSVNTATNEQYDKHSGNVFISSLNDEFDDKLYSYNFPSHWFYEQFRNLNYTPTPFTGNLTNGTFTYTGSENLKDYFVPGDIIRLSNGTSSGFEATLLKISTSYNVGNNLTTNTLNIINSNDGTVFNSLSGSLITLNLVKSNRKNRLSESMQSLVTKAIPNETTIISLPTQFVLSSSAVTYDEKLNVKCVPINQTINPNSKDVLVGATLNPFKYGVKGDYFVDGQFSWQSERIQSTHDHGIRFDGEYTNFTPFYFFDYDYRWVRIDKTNFNHFWRPSGDITKFDQFGNSIEGIDPIKVKSAVLYGYSPNLKLIPIAQASNASASDIAFDGFEDYSYANTIPYQQTETHFDFSRALTQGVSLINNSIRHSGNSSLEINGVNTVSVTKNVNSSVCNTNTDPISNGEYKAVDCICIKPFFPVADTFLVSVWVKGNSITDGSYTSPSVQISFGGPTYFFTALPSGNIIDGWQKIERVFFIPANATTVSVSLKNNSTGTVFFDDLRIHPYKSVMTTTVYDKNTLLPLATHDENNFTIFYNYDENLNQVRTRIETIDGIKTISESEVGLK
jgi:hypothetical protein